MGLKRSTAADLLHFVRVAEGQETQCPPLNYTPFSPRLMVSVCHHFCARVPCCCLIFMYDFPFPIKGMGIGVEIEGYGMMLEACPVFKWQIKICQDSGATQFIK